MTLDLNRIIVLQPYLFWRGHYRQYSENLLAQDHNFIYADIEPGSYPNSIFVQAKPRAYEASFFAFLYTRLRHAFMVMRVVLRLQAQSAGGLKLHFIEFEPFSFLYYMARRRKADHMVITVHSIERLSFSNPLKDFISRIQRSIYRRALLRANKAGAKFVVHYQYHERQLQELLGGGADITVNEYPAPPAKREEPKIFQANRRLLIYGQIRQDKGIYEFLHTLPPGNFTITVAGKIHDQRVYGLNNRASYTFLDRFIPDEELQMLIDSHDFLLLPYGNMYTGGAGPLKDAFGYGIPVIVSDIPIFRETVLAPAKGIVFQRPDDLDSLLDRVTPAVYSQWSAQALSYARMTTWARMRQVYFDIYQSL